MSQHYLHSDTILQDPRKNNDQPEITCDSLFDGELICQQHRHGYRFSVDAVLLAHFVMVSAGARIIDLGCGCGVIPMILCYRHREKIERITGIELQPDLASLARNNILRNRFGERINIIGGDVRDILNYLPPESYDAVVINPPFFSTHTGRLPVSSEAAIARHQLNGNLNDFLRSAAAAVKNKGAVYIVYPAGKITDIVRFATGNRLEPRRFRHVYSYPKPTSAGTEPQTARLGLIECCKNGGREAKVVEPLYIYSRKNGPYSEEMQRYMRKNSGPEISLGKDPL